MGASKRGMQGGKVQQASKQGAGQQAASQCKQTQDTRPAKQSELRSEQQAEKKPGKHADVCKPKYKLLQPEMTVFFNSALTFGEMCSCSAKGGCRPRQGSESGAFIAESCKGIPGNSSPFYRQPSEARRHGVKKTSGWRASTIFVDHWLRPGSKMNSKRKSSRDKMSTASAFMKQACRSKAFLGAS